MSNAKKIAASFAKMQLKQEEEEVDDDEGEMEIIKTITFKTKI